MIVYACALINAIIGSIHYIIIVSLCARMHNLQLGARFRNIFQFVEHFNCTQLTLHRGEQAIQNSFRPQSAGANNVDYSRLKMHKIRTPYDQFFEMKEKTSSTQQEYKFICIIKWIHFGASDSIWIINKNFMRFLPLNRSNTRQSNERSGERCKESL